MKEDIFDEEYFNELVHFTRERALYFAQVDINDKDNHAMSLAVLNLLTICEILRNRVAAIEREFV